MLTSNICFIAVIVFAVIAFISLFLILKNKCERIATKVFITSFVLFLIAVFTTTYFQGQEAPHCPICETLVDTNYCPDCGINMKNLEEK